MAKHSCSVPLGASVRWLTLAGQLAPQSSRMNADHVRCDFRLGGKLNIRLSDRIMCLVG